MNYQNSAFVGLLYIQGGARYVISLIVHITHFYYYKAFDIRYIINPHRLENWWHLSHFPWTTAFTRTFATSILWCYNFNGMIKWYDISCATMDMNNNQHDIMFIFSFWIITPLHVLGVSPAASSRGRMYICSRWYVLYSSYDYQRIWLEWNW
jgi:hypothetical protein